MFRIRRTSFFSSSFRSIQRTDDCFFGGIVGCISFEWEQNRNDLSGENGMIFYNPGTLELQMSWGGNLAWLKIFLVGRTKLPFIYRFPRMLLSTGERLCESGWNIQHGEMLLTRCNVLRLDALIENHRNLSEARDQSVYLIIREILKRSSQKSSSPLHGSVANGTSPLDFLERFGLSPVIFAWIYSASTCPLIRRQKLYFFKSMLRRTVGWKARKLFQRVVE